MKNKSLIIVFIMLAGAFSAIGQSHLWEFPTCPADTSIVREWKDGKYLVYSSDGITQKVTLHDNASSPAVSVNLPSLVYINDFRIANDTVFAGGYLNNASSRVGLLACFDINDMIIGSSTFQWMTFTNTNLSISNCEIADYDVLITEVNRISLFKDGPLTRIAFLANNNIVDHGNPSIVYLQRVGYGDAAFIGAPVTPWELNQYHYNKDGVEEYTDIACTDNRIVITAKDKDYNWFHFMVFNRTANFANYSPLSPPIYYFTDHTVAEQVMVADCGGDKVAVTYNFSEPANRGIAVKYLNVGSGAPVLLNSIDIPLGSSAYLGTMRDTRYCQSSNCLRFLTDAYNPITSVWGHHIYTIDMSNIYAGIYEAIFIIDKEFHSLDNFLSNGIVTSGLAVPYGYLNVYYHDYSGAPDVCCKTVMVPGISSSPAYRTFGRHHCIIEPDKFSNSIFFNTYGEDVGIECE